MLRYLSLAMLSVILTGCSVVVIPFPVDMSKAPTVVAAVTSAGTADRAKREQAEFMLRYNSLGEPWHELRPKLEDPHWDDPAWRAEVARLAKTWRGKISDLRDLQQPTGEAWVKAWPVLLQGLDEYNYVAGAIQTAAETNEPALLEPMREHLLNGINLLGESMRLLSGE